MINPNQLEALVKKLYKALPSGIQSVEQDIKQQFKDILRAGFTNMDLLTREEFDVQVKVLERTREKVDLLEKQLEQFITRQK